MSKLRKWFQKYVGKNKVTRSSADSSGMRIIDCPGYGDDLKIAVMDGVVSEKLQEEIIKGKYEWFEGRAIQKVVKEGDVLLEIGAGVGFISTIAWRTGKLQAVHCYEADPRLIPIIAKTHALNKVRGTIQNVILTTDAEVIRSKSIDFFIREDFYGSSQSQKNGGGIQEVIKVPTQRFQDALNNLAPTIIACDIEGAELGLFNAVQCPSVDRIMLETHQYVFGGDGMRQLFNELHDCGFHYNQYHSAGAVCVFQRINPQ
jgi:FkbM family methyltransferase